MNLWERWEQCKSCYAEHGWDEQVGVTEEGYPIIEHFFECSKGENCDTDFRCERYEEDE